MEHPGSPPLAPRLRYLIILILNLLMVPSALAGITIGESSDPVEAGSGPGNLAYTVQAENLSTRFLDITLSLPTGVTLAQMPQPSPGSVVRGDPQSGSFSWELPDLANPYSLTVSLTVEAFASSGDQVSISVVEQPLSPGDSPVPVAESTSIDAPSPAFSLTLDDAPDPVVLGQILEYELVIANTGDAIQAVVEYEFLFPPEVSYLDGAIGSCFVSESLLSCLGGSLSPGEKLTVPIRVAVDSLPAPDNQGDFLLFAVARLVDPQLSVNEETRVLEAVAPPELGLAESADPVVAGSGSGNLVYTLRAENLAGFGSSVLVSLSRPVGVSLDGVVLSNPNSSIGGDPQQGGFSWIPASDDESLILPLTVGADASAGDQVTIAALEQTEREDPPPRQVEAATDIINASPALTLAIDDISDPVILGDRLEYRLLLGNEGSGTADIVEYQFSFPPEVSYLDGGIGSCFVTEAILNCVSGPLPPGQNRTVPITVSVDRLPPPDAEGAYFLDAFATIVATEIFDSETTQVLAPTLMGPDLGIRKEAPSSASVGDIISYRLVVRNNDTSRTAVAITAVDFLPSGVTPLGNPDCRVPVDAEIAKNGAIVSCSIETLSPGAERIFELPVRVDLCEDSLVNQAEVSYLPGSQDPPGMDPDTSNDSASAVTSCTVIPPEETADLAIFKSDSSDPVSAGGLLGYELRVVNQGPDPAVGVLVRDRLPTGVSVVELPPGCRDQGFQISCRQASLGVGEQLRYAFTVELDDSVDTSLRNSATVDSITRDPLPGNNRAVELTRVNAPAPSADLLVEKAVADSVAPGASFDYRITVMNAGLDSAEAVTLDDTLPAVLTALGADASQGGCELGETVRCELGSLASGASVGVTLTVSLDPAARGEIVNTAQVTSTTTDPNPDNNRASARTVVALDRVTLPAGAVCSRYRAALESPGEAEPLSPAPPGLEFFREEDALILAGVPEVAGDYTILVRVDTADGGSRQVFFDLTVASAGLAITPPSPVPGQRLPPAVVGSGYGFQLRAQGGNEPYRWTIDSEAPPGLTLYSSGLLAGRPTGSGNFSLSVQVSDALDNSAGLTLRLQVQSAALTDRTPDLPAGLLGLDYRVPALLDGAPPPFDCGIASGALPPGLSLVGDCRIQGIPTEAGEYPFSLRIHHPGLPPITSNRRLRIAANTPIPRGQSPRLTPLPAVSLPVPPRCLPELAPDELIQQGTVDPFGNRYLVGSIRVEDQYDLLLRKIDPAGELIWEQRFDSGGDDRGYAVTVTPDLRIVAAGLLNTGERYRGLVLTYGFSGARLWERRIGTTEVTAFYGVAADTRGLYLAGERYNGLNFDALLLALTPDGEIRWQALRDSRDTETAYRVALLPCATADTAACQLVVGGFRGRERGEGWLERRDRAGNLLDSHVLPALPVEALTLIGEDPVVGGATDEGWRVRRLSGDFNGRWTALLPIGETLRALTHDIEGNVYAAGRVDNPSGAQDGFLWLLSATGVALDQVRFDEGEDERLTAVMIGPAGRLSVAGQRRGVLGNRVLLLEVDNGKRFADALQKR